MVTISVRTDIKDATKYLHGVARKAIPIATAKALTFTAEKAQQEVTRLIPEVFSNPTPFTRNSIRKTTATVSRPEAAVLLKDISLARPHYLLPQIYGGRRPLKRAEKRLGGYWVPGKDAKRNQYGNLTQGTWSKILADVGRLGLFTGDAANTKRKSLGGKKNIQYFMRRSEKTGRRIIYRVFAGKRIIPWLVEIGPPHYGVRLPFERIVRNVASQRFDGIFEKQLRRELVKLGFNSVV